jgi:hypothetical protein
LGIGYAMFASRFTANSSEYAPLNLHSDEEDSTATHEKSSSDYHHSPSASPANTNTRTRSALLKIIFCLSLALALLSAANIALLPAILSTYHAQSGPTAGLAATEPTAPDVKYERSWPDRIARVSRKMKTAVWGQASQVYITVEVRSLATGAASPTLPGVSSVTLSNFYTKVLIFTTGLNHHAFPRPTYW